ncbi:MAG: tetratricopeptide repeat protein, partial [Candidatus Ratteibacteria bacterium]
MKKYLVLTGLLLIFTGCVTPNLKRDIALKTYVSGLLYENEKNNLSAIKEFEETIKKGGPDPYVYIKIGNLYIKEKNYKKAKEIFQKALNLNPTLPEPYFGIGLSNLLEKKYYESAKYIEKGLKIKPDSSSFRLIL